MQHQVFTHNVNHWEVLEKPYHCFNSLERKQNSEIEFFLKDIKLCSMIQEQFSTWLLVSALIYILLTIF